MFIRGRRLLISSRLEGAAFINFQQAGGGAVYSRAAFINFQQAGGGSVYSRAAFINFQQAGGGSV